MRVTILLFTFTGLVLSSFYLAEAQQPTKVVRMGFLSSRSAPAVPRSFRDALHNLGYIEGQNLVKAAYANACSEIVKMVRLSSKRELGACGGKFPKPAEVIEIKIDEVRNTRHASERKAMESRVIGPCFIECIGESGQSRQMTA